jgi:AraC family transcriptional regulator
MSTSETATALVAERPVRIELSEAGCPPRLPESQIDYRCYRAGALAPWQAKRLQTYIQEHLNTRILATDLAELARLSLSHFSRTFRETFGRTPANYIAYCRMRRAQQLMLESTHSLVSIALECGLADQSHFTRVFRRIWGVSPGLWRRLNTDGPPPRDAQY